MIERTDGQMSMFDQDTWCGRTSQDHSPATKAKTFKPSSRKSSGSSSRPPLMCLCLTRDGHTQGASTARWETGLLPIGCMTHSIGEFRREENGLLSLPISTGLPHRKFFLTLNCGEKPRVPNPTKLSEILQPETDPKYRLSATACKGILTRAARRGKELPKALLDALTEQAQSVSKNELESQGGAKDCSSRMNEQEHCQPSQTNPSSSDAPQAFGICSFDSNAMKSPNPRSGFYEADTSRTLDLNGGNPACNQGGVLVRAITSAHKRKPLAAAVDCRNGTENPFVNGTLQAKEQGQNLNSNNVVRVPK